MGIAEDIKAAYVEVGVGYSVLKPTGQLFSGEFLMYESNTQVTKPFVREFFLEVSLPFDTNADVGDVVRFTESGVAYLLVSKTHEAVENRLIEFSSVLYKANVSGELTRFSGEGRDGQLRIVPVWTNIRSCAYGTLVESQYGGGLEEQEAFTDTVVSRLELHLPSAYGVKVDDRYSPISGEYYRVYQVKSKSFDGIDIALLEEDTREN